MWEQFFSFVFLVIALKHAQDGLNVEAQTVSPLCEHLCNNSASDEQSCYTTDQECDGVKDCKDGTDEKDCRCGSYREKRCYDGRCINRDIPCSKWDCDFHSCDDLSKCYRYYEWCNDYSTCKDGSDEKNCHLKVVPKPHWTEASSDDWRSWSTWYEAKHMRSGNSYSGPKREPSWEVFVGIFVGGAVLLSLACGIRQWKRKNRPRTNANNQPEEGVGLAPVEPRDPVVDLPPDYQEAVTDVYKAPEDPPQSNIDDTGLPSYNHAVSSGMSASEVPSADSETNPALWENQGAREERTPEEAVHITQL